MTTDEQIDEIMDWFDFAKVAKTMQALDWVWYESGGDIPEEGEIRKHARSLMKQAVKKEYKYFGSGGFVVEYDKDAPLIVLKFVVSEWSITL